MYSSCSFAHCLKCFIFVPDLCKYLKGLRSYCADTISIVKFGKGHTSVKNVGGVMVLVL